MHARLRDFLYARFFYARFSNIVSLMLFDSVLSPLLFICIRDIAVILTCLDVREFDLLRWVKPRVVNRVLVHFDLIDKRVIV